MQTGVVFRPSFKTSLTLLPSCESMLAYYAWVWVNMLDLPVREVRFCVSVFASINYDSNVSDRLPTLTFTIRRSHDVKLHHNCRFNQFPIIARVKYMFDNMYVFVGTNINIHMIQLRICHIAYARNHCQTTMFHIVNVFT